MYKVYCAGPLFNNKEQEEMKELSDVLEHSGYRTFLPQRDGLELAKISNYLYEFIDNQEDVNKILEKAIFCLDIYQVITSDALVLNMNGRVPDEGAMVEAGVAWAYDKPVVIYKNDFRSFINGTDNPMILGLASFQKVTSIKDIPGKLNSLIINNQKNDNLKKIKKEDAIVIGERIADFISDCKDARSIALELFNVIKEETRGGNSVLRR